MIAWPEMEANIRKIQEEIPELAKYSPLAIFTKAREGIEWRDIIAYTGLKRDKVRNAYLWTGYKIPLDLIPKLPDDGLIPRSVWLDGSEITRPKKKKGRKDPTRRQRTESGKPMRVIYQAVQEAGKWITVNELIAITNYPQTTVWTNLTKLCKEGKIQRQGDKKSGVLWGTV